MERVLGSKGAGRFKFLNHRRILVRCRITPTIIQVPHIIKENDEAGGSGEQNYLIRKFFVKTDPVDTVAKSQPFSCIFTLDLF